MFIILTQIDGQFNTSPVFINTDNISHIFAQERTLKYRYNPETKTSTELNPPDIRGLSVVCFSVGLQEEPDSIWVTETMDEIWRMVK